MKTQLITTSELITAAAKATKERNTTMNNTINAQFISIHLPAKLQQKYINHQLYIQLPENIIRKSPDFLKDPHSQTRSYRFDHNHNIIYKESNLIQIIWLTEPDNNYFITTYKPRETKTITETIPGSYGTSITQTYTVEHDYLRDYLLKHLCTQAPLDINRSNRDILNTIIKERDNIIYQFTVKQEQNGQYLNTRYYPVYIKTDAPDIPEETPEEITQ